MLRNCLTFLCLLMALLPASVQGHELRPTIISLIYQDDGSARMDVDLNLEAALAGIGSAHEDTDEAPEAAIYDALRLESAAQLAARLDAGELDAASLITIPGTVAIPLARDIPEVGDPELPRHSILSFTITGFTPPETTLTWSGLGAAAILRVDGNDGAQLHSEFLQPGATSALFAVQGGEAQSLLAVFVNYIIVGFEHIIPLGLDHILFVIGLFLLSTRLRPLLWQVTAFTLAHTVTLALGTLGLVNIPSCIVEPLIALSITYVCLENIVFKQMTVWRPAVIFCFGLLHGLGFAGVLGEVGLSGEFLFTSLIAFNIGVEIGQLTVIAICMLLVGIWFGKKDWYRAVVVIPGSLAIGAIGLFWFVERIGLV